MINLFKILAKKIRFLYYTSSSDKYVEYLKKKGVKIGKNVTFHAPYDVMVDITQPTLIEIGNNVEITKGVVILCHDYAWCVQKQIDGNILGSNKAVTIGDNVFIGINAIILKGVSIGNNVIIGSGSVVTKDLESNGVYAGVPAKKINTIDTYFKDRQQFQVLEASELLKSYQKLHGKNPPKELFRDFFFLFEERKEIYNLNHKYIEILSLGGNKEKSIQAFNSTEPVFNGFKDFVDKCGILSRLN